jgi:uncharacterized membrane protein YidH (DUF202 family)
MNATLIFVAQTIVAVGAIARITIARSIARTIASIARSAPRRTASIGVVVAVSVVVVIVVAVGATVVVVDAVSVGYGRAVV